jgi:hypothetical protein
MSASPPPVSLASVVATPGLRLALLPFLIPSDLQSLMRSSKLLAHSCTTPLDDPSLASVHPEHVPHAPTLGEERAETPPTLVSVLSIPGLHVLPFLSLSDFRSLLFSSKVVARSFDLPLDDLFFRRYSCGDKFVCREHLLQAGKVGWERGESERCCHDMRHGDGPWHERGTFFCPGCLKGELAKTREFPQCEETYCMACIGREGGHACYYRRIAHVDGGPPVSDLVPHPCYTCPTHGFGCEHIYTCSPCYVDSCGEEEPHFTDCCEYCGQMFCRDCLTKLGVEISYCTDWACQSVYVFPKTGPYSHRGPLVSHMRHCFPPCVGKYGNIVGQLNLCKGVPDRDY